MSKYIFIDNWVLGRLTDKEFCDHVVKYIVSNGYVVILNSLSLTELYNPNWKDGDRTETAAKFYSLVPCVVVDPAKVKEAEIANNLNRLDELPVEMDLRNIKPEERKKLLLGALRGDPIFLKQGVDISKWDQGYKKEKSEWLSNVDKIIGHAIENKTIKKNKKARKHIGSADKETFLLSLDMREVPPIRFDLVFNYRLSKIKSLEPCSGTRFSSLLFWYLYVDEDPSNKIKHGGSDIGDIHQMSLIPYCDVFTLDKSMFKLVGRVKSESNISNIQLLTKKQLELKIHHCNISA